MEVQFAPNAVDEPNLLYKLQKKIKVFQTSDPLPNRGYSLVTSSSKYALVFVAVPNGTLSVYQLDHLVDKECEPQHISMKLQEKPTHIAVNCDQELLLVTGGQLLSFFKVTDFQHQNVSPSLNIKTDVNPSTFVSSLQWNPCAPESIAIAFYDGTLLACNVSNGQVKKVPSKARCICWSPKGKQLVTGNSDGTLCQYKPDLTPAKVVPAPNLFEGAPVETLAIYWISTYQFAVVYKNASDNSRPAVTIINTTKTGQLTCINYEDICYSMGSNRPSYYYLQGLPVWNLILASSSNSMELATLGSTDGSNWIQWSQSDEARPDLPLTDNKQESYPVGVCIDTCGIHQLPWGENQVLPHMPLLHIVSQSGLLTTFNIINLNINSPPVCAPPHLLTLPAAAMTSEIIDDTIAKKTQVTAAVLPAEPKIEQIQQQSFSQAVPPTNQFSAIQNVVPIKPPTAQLQMSQAFAPAPSAQVTEPKNLKPIQQSQPQISVAKHKSTPEPESTAQIEENAAMKAEQERLSKLKANQELKNMLVKEVNDFQMELYKFMVKTRETQARLQRDIESINANFNLSSLDIEQLKKDCSLDELKSDIVQLKLELVRACAVVAEARTHAETKDLHQWTQADPLTSKRVASVKKLAYYVQTQLEQAQKALDYKWKELEARDAKLRPGQRMIRPILDDVYQPLVKQQEILSRQQAVLRTLRNTLNECDITPMFKSTKSLLRSTPFRNKDPLSKLTKNILNMSLERQTETKKPHLSATKLDALRDILSNHKTVKIKPVNVELRQQLAAMKLNYEKSMKEMAMKRHIQQAPIETAPETQVKVEPHEPPAPPIMKVEPKVAPLKIQPFIAPSFTPVTNNMKPIAPGVANVARTLFVDEPKQELPKPVQQTPQIPVQPTKPVPVVPNSPTNTRSVLKDLLQNKTQNAAEPKTESNILKSTPNAFSFTTTSATSQAPAAANIFESKPLSGINNMFNQFQPQIFAPQAKPQTVPNPKSEETGEPETSIVTPKPFTVQTKANKPLTNLFGMKQTSSFVASTPSASDVSRSNQQEDLPKSEKVVIKSVEKVSEKLKENIPQKAVESPKDQANDMKENIVKPLVLKTVNKEPTPVLSIPQVVATSAPTVKTFGESQKPVVSKTEVKDETPTSDKTTKSTASSIFAAANASIVTKPQPVIGTVTTASSEANTPSDIDTLSPDDSPTNLSMEPSVFGSPTTTTSSASSIFSAAVASQPKITTASGSIFSTSPVSTTSSVFGSTQGSLFGATSTNQSSIFGSPTTESVFSGTAAKPSVFSTPSPSSPTPVFGTTTQSGSIFGSAFTQATTQSVFGSGNTTSMFGAPTSTQSPVFATTTATTASIFGTSTATTQPSVFGASTTTAPSVFSAPSTQSSIFGSVTTTTPSLFGAATPATQASVFGTSGSSSVFDSPSASTPNVFGGAVQTSMFGTTTPPSTQASVFGTSAPASQPSIFGTTQTTQASIFGAPPTTTQTSSLFGGAEANLFASASISTTSAPTQGSGGNIFGSGSSGSVFGSSSNTSVFGGKTTFGQPNPTAASIFGGGASFGQKPATNLWSGGNTSEGGFASTGFGQPATTQSSSLFGGTSGESFSSSAPSQPFGSPQPAPAFGSGDATPSVFGTPAQQTAPGFGGSPVFGSKPVFGQSTGFGSPTSGGGFGSFGGFNKSPSSGFGASASFGGGAFGGTTFGNTSPGKAFGGAAPGFGSPTQSNSTFENLANQNTVTFGNLAQQSGQPAQPAPTFNTSPSFTGWRG